MNSGLDPEVLVLHEGAIVAASNFIGPPELDEHGVLNQLSFDNAAIEMRPQHSDQVKTLANNLGALFHTASDHVRTARKRQTIPQDARIMFIPAAELRVEDQGLDSVTKFGCSPSRLLDDGYGSSDTVPNLCANDTNIRSAGFHVHQELEHPGTVQATVAVLDGMIGLWDVVMNQRFGWSEASRLRRLELGYGRAGEHRVRRVSSGALVLEYRSMSPWPLGDLFHVRKLVTAVRTVSSRPLMDLMKVLENFPPRDKITRAINEADHSAATVLRQECMTAWRETLRK